MTRLILFTLMLQLVACSQQEDASVAVSTDRSSMQSAAVVPNAAATRDATAQFNSAAGQQRNFSQNYVNQGAGMTLASYQDILSQYKPVKQTFYFSTQLDTVIQGKEGTCVAFPSDVLVDQNGNRVSGAVALELTEYVKPSQFAAAGLITRTVDGDLLETVGMVNLVALQGKDTLKLAEGEEISIAFPLSTTQQGYKAWSALRTADGLAEWKEMKRPVAMKENVIVPVHMHAHAGANTALKSKQLVRYTTCSGKSWQAYFNNRFRFDEGTGEELLEEENFLAYSFQVNKKGVVQRVFVENMYPKHILALSAKYLPQIQKFFQNYPRLNMCEVGVTAKATFQFKVMPGNSVKISDLIELSPEEGGYTTNELRQLYQSTNEDRYLSAYLARMGTEAKGNIPQTKATVSRKMISGFLGAAGEVGRVVLRTASLGLINGDHLLGLGISRFPKGAAFRTAVSGAGAAVYMVFKRTRSFLQGTLGASRFFEFGSRVPKGEKVLMVAVSERNGARFMQRMEYTTSDNDVQMMPDVPFDLELFEKWLDRPGAQ